MCPAVSTGPHSRLYYFSFPQNPSSVFTFQERGLARGLLPSTERCQACPGTRSWREQNPPEHPLGPITIFFPPPKSKKHCLVRALLTSCPLCSLGIEKSRSLLNACWFHWPWRAWIDAPKDGCHLFCTDIHHSPRSPGMPGLQGAGIERRHGTGMNRCIRGSDTVVSVLRSDLSALHL